MDKVLALSNASLFKEVSEHILVNIAEHLTVKQVARGHSIIQKGNIGSSMYIIIDGQLIIKDGENILATLKAGEIVGELSILAPVKRTADVIAQEDCILYELYREDFLELLYYHRSMNRNIMGVLVDRIIQLNNQVQNV